MRRLRAAHRVGRTVMLRLRFDDFARATRSHTIPGCDCEHAHGARRARALLAAAQPLIEERGLTLIGIAFTNLSDDLPRQLALPVTGDDGGALDVTLDGIQDRFGSPAVTRAVLLRAGRISRCRCCPTDAGSRQTAERPWM